MSSINRTNECCFVKEGKGAIDTVISVVDTALANFKLKTDLAQQYLQPIKFMILSNRMPDMTGFDIMIAVKKFFNEKMI